MNVIECLIAEAMIIERDGKYYSSCHYGEEVTQEVKEIKQHLEG